MEHCHMVQHRLESPGKLYKHLPPLKSASIIHDVPIQAADIRRHYPHNSEWNTLQKKPLKHLSEDIGGIIQGDTKFINKNHSITAEILHHTSR